MSDKMKYVKIKRENGTYTDAIPVAVDAANVQFPDGRTLIQATQDFINGTDIAVKFNSTEVYNPGDYVYNNQNLYRVLVKHNANVSWDSWYSVTNAQQIILTDEIKNMIYIGTSQPSNPANKVWINSGLTSTIQIPTYSEFENLRDSIAEQYSAKTYSKGEYCINDNKLYRCKADIATAEATFVPSHWQLVNAGDEIYNLKDDINENVDGLKSAIGCAYKYDNVTQFATITDNYFIQDDGTVKSANGWSVYEYACSAGDVLRITACAYNGKYYYAFYNDSDTLISGELRSESGTGTTTDEIKAPHGAVKIVVVGRPASGNPAKIENSKYSFSYVDDKIDTLGSYVDDKIDTLGSYVDDKIDTLSSSLDVHPVYKINVTATATTQDDFFIQYDGTISTASGWTVYTVPVKENDSLMISAWAYSGKYYYAFYNDSGAFISGEKRTESGTGSKTFVIVVPQNAVKLAVVGRPNNNTPATIYAPQMKRTKWYGKKWVVFGDSLTELNVRTTKHYFDYIADETGITIYNMGNGGSGYASERELGTAFYQRISDVPIDSDVITIFGSFNDLSEIGTGNGQIPLGDANDNDTSTVGGLINVTLDNLFTAFPLANVGVVTPTPWVYANPLTEPNSASAYVDLIIEVCKHRGIPCLDLFHCSALRPWSSDFRVLAYSKDEGNGVHPDETGHKIIAPRFEAFLDSLLIH